jgi:AcrR family transcriptional regulator
MHEKKSSLRQRNHERTRQRILEAALALFTADGYEQTTMDAIAERAEVGRATLFKYFPSKSSLVLQLSQQILQIECRPKVKAYLEQQPDTLSALEYYFRLIGERIDGLSNEALELIQVLASMKDEVVEHIPDFVDVLYEILRYGQERGDVRTDMQVEELTQFISILYGALIHHAVQMRHATGYDELARRFLLFMETGLLGKHFSEVSASDVPFREM